jgi:hypothetical protein
VTRRILVAGRAASALLAAALLVAACGNAAPPASSASSSAGPGVASSGGPSLPVVVPSSAPGTPITAPSGATTVLDPTLMALLPATIAGVAVTQEAGSLAEAVADQAFVASVDRAAFPLAVSGGDLASGVIAHLRSGVYSDKMFADWRASYDDGACASSAGVVAHAEKAIGGRTTYVTTCGGGLRVYQAYVASQGVIASLFSTGPADLGGQLMAGLGG